MYDSHTSYPYQPTKDDTDAIMYLDRQLAIQDTRNRNPLANQARSEHAIALMKNAVALQYGMRYKY
jgi:hypothetical protein